MRCTAGSHGEQRWWRDGAQDVVRRPDSTAEQPFDDRRNSRRGADVSRVLVSLALAHPLLNGYHSVPVGRGPSVSEQPAGEHSASLEGIAPEGEQIATYREIAAHWGLAGVDVARVKAKRAGWRQLPRNHPADPVRVAIPRAIWDVAVMNGGGTSGLQGEVTTPPSKPDARPP